MRTVVSPGPAAISRTPTLKYWASAPTSMYATVDPRSAIPVQSSCQVILNLRAASACSTAARADPGSPVTTKSTYVLATVHLPSTAAGTGASSPGRRRGRPTLSTQPGHGQGGHVGQMTD